MILIECPDVQCNWSQERGDDDTARRALHRHQERWHGAAPLPEPVTPVGQLGYPAFQAAYIKAVRDLPIGHEFTTADLHGVVPDPLDSHYWGRAQAAASHMGLITKVAAQQSELDTTKSSLLYRWVRVVEGRRTA